MMMVVVGWMHDKGCPEEYPPPLLFSLPHSPPSLSLSLSLSFSLCPSCARLARSIFHESRDLTHTASFRMDIQYGGGGRRCVAVEE